MCRGPVREEVEEEFYVSCDYDSVTCFHEHVRQGDIQSAYEHLIHEPRLANAPDVELSRNALMMAAERGDLEMTILLCDMGADVMGVDDLCRTAMHYAATNEEGGPVIAEIWRRGLSLQVRMAQGVPPCPY